MEEPQVSVSQTGVNVAKLKVGVEKTNKEKETTQEMYEITCFRNLATQEYKVGSLIGVSGKLQASTVSRDDHCYYNVALLANAISTIS